ncbi:glycosyltransferase family 2 protein [Agrococcus beijingensis]|uniref:glycosyltransferase family 2 protein n=1 Tax=Agrococcus beijingensis TaxID=3068634 RepID=UPI002741A1AF|nr:glycosyltransferase family 2 protein [Agrococcus sp. REN33]
MTFDIMLPFYGRFDHFQVAVESVLAQSHRDIRLVVVDDVYPDTAPGEWVQSLGDDRVEYHRNAQNLGVSRNYLHCVDLMRSPFSMLMGGDDVMLPGFVERVLELAARFPDVDVIQTGVTVIGGEGEPSNPLADRVKTLLRPRGAKPAQLRGEPLATSLARANWTYFPSLVWRVETIRRIGFRADLDVVQDIAMLLEIARTGGSLVLDDDVHFRYRRHSSSVSATTAVSGARFDQERQVFDEAAAAFEAQGWGRAASAASRRMTSRLNAISQLPLALRAGDAAGRSSLLRHAFG